MNQFLASQKEVGDGFLFLYVHRYAWVALINLVFVFMGTGCASFDSSDYRQTVLVQSTPPGAEILDSDGKIIGKTPSYIRVRRGHHPKISLRMPNRHDREIPLHATYRWVDSGVSNLVFYLFAPVGWGVDWLTGTMWKMEDPPVQKFEGIAEVAGPPPDQIVAIAPPKGVEVESADGLGLLIQKDLREDHWTVRDYEETAPIFDYYGSSEGLTKNKTDRYNLFYQLKAQRVLTGEAVLTSDHLEFKGQMQDVYTGKTVQEIDWDLAPTAAGSRSSLSWEHFYERYLHFLPNTVFLNLSNYQAKVSIDGQENIGHSTRAPGIFNGLLDDISYLGLSHIERPRDNVKAHFTIGLVPAVILSSKRIEFDSYQPVKGVEFDRWNFGLGYGGEVGYLSRYGFAYFDYIPTLTWTQISFSNEFISEKLSRWSGTQTLELGYSYFITKHLVAKVFARTLNEDTGLWTHALQDAGGNQPAVSNLNSVFSGISLGYFFPSSLQTGEDWRVIPHSKASTKQE